jgi:hypothetical protein
MDGLSLELPKQNRSFGKVPGLLLSDVLLIVGIGLGLLVILASGLYLWKSYSRKRRRHISGGEKVYRDNSEAAAGSEDARDSSSASDEEDDESTQSRHHRRRYKYRVRRRTHRSRNPTLSEAGGLPPIKAQEPSKPL